MVDPETGELAGATAAVGRLLLTHLDRRGTVLLRYAVGDLTAIEDGECPSCGRVGPRIVGPPQRLDNLVKVRGTLINPDVVIAALSEVVGLDDFQVAVTRPGSGETVADDMLQVRATGPDAGPDLAGRIAVAVREACEVRPDVLLLAAPEFARLLGPYKFRRFVDERPSLEE